jgi:hypothetical protein
MFLFLIQLFILCPSLFNEYLCPIDAYGWTLFDNKTEQIYQWIYNKKTEEFNRDFSLIEIREKSDLICFDIHRRMYQVIKNIFISIGYVIIIRMKVK